MAVKGIVGGLARGKASLAPDFVIEVYQEKLEHNGEDSYYFGLGDVASVVGAFDGSGGSGARRYEKWQGKTGAYLGSRVLSGAVRDWYVTGGAELESDEAARLLKERATSYLGVCKEACGGSSRLRGRMVKEFPSTCAIIAYREVDGAREALSLWAGDSRCYLLNAQGLHQLSVDDLSGGLDAMENLTADGVMTNVVSASGDFVLHAHVVSVEGPCVLLAATDGCFGYLRTPMEFEYLLLWTLAESESPVGWEDRLHTAMTAVAGDDVTLCGLSVGYGDFARLKEALRPRLQEVYERYARDIADLDLEGKRALWEQYKGEYYALAPRETH